MRAIVSVLLVFLFVLAPTLALPAAASNIVPEGYYIEHKIRDDKVYSSAFPGDIDSDGFDELLVIDKGGSLGYYKYNNGEYDYTQLGSGFAADGTESLHCLDLLGDSRNELIYFGSYMGYDKGVFVFNVTGGHLSLSRNYSLTGCRWLGIFDLNKDGKADVVKAVSNPDSNIINISVADSFDKGIGNQTVGFRAAGVTAADIDGDGYTELMFWHYNYSSGMSTADIYDLSNTSHFNVSYFSMHTTPYCIMGDACSLCADSVPGAELFLLDKTTVHMIGLDSSGHMVDKGSLYMGHSFNVMTVGDPDNDGAQELVLAASDTYKTGSIHTIEINGVNMTDGARSTCYISPYSYIAVFDADSDGKNEIVGLRSNGYKIDVLTTGHMDESEYEKYGLLFVVMFGTVVVMTIIVVVQAIILAINFKRLNKESGPRWYRGKYTVIILVLTVVVILIQFSTTIFISFIIGDLLNIVVMGTLIALTIIPIYILYSQLKRKYNRTFRVFSLTPVLMENILEDRLRHLGISRVSSGDDRTCKKLMMDTRVSKYSVSKLDLYIELYTNKLKRLAPQMTIMEIFPVKKQNKQAVKTLQSEIDKAFSPKYVAKAKREQKRALGQSLKGRSKKYNIFNMSPRAWTNRFKMTMYALLLSSVVSMVITMILSIIIRDIIFLVMMFILFGIVCGLISLMIFLMQRELMGAVSIVLMDYDMESVDDAIKGALDEKGILYTREEKKNRKGILQKVIYHLNSGRKIKLVKLTGSTVPIPVVAIHPAKPDDDELKMLKDLIDSAV